MRIKAMMKACSIAAALSVLLGWTACDGPPQLDVRTFPLEGLRDYEAQQLLQPYVYEGRPRAPGTLSVTNGAITIRETPDNLEKIERVLAEYDRVRPDVRLHFQLIEADGFTDSDARIATVEAELRKIFRFGGYRLVGEAFVTATDGSAVTQGMQGTDDAYDIRSEVYWVGPGAIRLEEVTLFSDTGGRILSTTVNIRPGQTLVLGSSPKEGSGTLLLTVRAEEATSISNQ